MEEDDWKDMFPIPNEIRMSQLKKMLASLKTSYNIAGEA